MGKLYDRYLSWNIFMIYKVVQKHQQKNKKDFLIKNKFLLIKEFDSSIVTRI